jgi:hypothetical protein
MNIFRAFTSKKGAPDAPDIDIPKVGNIVKRVQSAELDLTGVENLEWSDDEFGESLNKAWKVYSDTIDSRQQSIEPLLAFCSLFLSLYGDVVDRKVMVPSWIDGYEGVDGHPTEMVVHIAHLLFEASEATDDDDDDDEHRDSEAASSSKRKLSSKDRDKLISVAIQCLAILVYWPHNRLVFVTKLGAPFVGVIVTLFQMLQKRLENLVGQCESKIKKKQAEKVSMTIAVDKALGEEKSGTDGTAEESTEEQSESKETDDGNIDDEHFFYEFNFLITTLGHLARVIINSSDCAEIISEFVSDPIWKRHCWGTVMYTNAKELDKEETFRTESISWKPAVYKGPLGLGDAWAGMLCSAAISTYISDLLTVYYSMVSVASELYPVGEFKKVEIPAEGSTTSGEQIAPVCLLAINEGIFAMGCIVVVDPNPGLKSTEIAESLNRALSSQSSIYRDSFFELAVQYKRGTLALCINELALSRADPSQDFRIEFWAFVSDSAISSFMMWIHNYCQ